MSRNRSLSVKRKKRSESPSSSQDSVAEIGHSRTSEKKKTKASRQSTRSKESILNHFEKITSEMAASTTEKDITDIDSDKCAVEENEEPSNKDIMKMLRYMTDTFNKKFDHLGETMEILKGEIFTLQQENDKLKSEIAECRKKEEDMQRKINEAAFEAKLAAERSDRNEQYSRRNNIKLLYVEERSGTFETAEESEEKALRLFHNKLGLRHIKPEHIEAAHRIGKRRDGHTRPIIVKFISRKTKNEIIQNRKKLKNSTPKTVIVEDLTKNIYTLYRQAANHPGTLRCWTTDGRIFAKDMDSRIHRIDCLQDLMKLSIDVHPCSSSGPTRRQQYQNTRNGRWADLFTPPLSSTGDIEAGQRHHTRFFPSSTKADRRYAIPLLPHGIEADWKRGHRQTD